MAAASLLTEVATGDLSQVFGAEVSARETVQDRVYRQISHLLLCGYFRPGETISLRQMASGLVVSETPVRTALNRLVADNAIDVMPNRYFCVPSLTEVQFTELMDLRLLLERDLMRHCYRAATRQDIRELGRLNDIFVQSRSKGHIQNTLEANLNFHFGLYAIADRPMTLALVRSVWLRAGSVIGMALRVGGALWSEDFHVAIVNGLRNRDEDACLQAIEGDVRHSFDLIKSHSRSDVFRAAL